MTAPAFGIGDQVRFVYRGPSGTIVNVFEIAGTPRFAKIRTASGETLIAALRELAPAAPVQQ